MAGELTLADIADRMDAMGKLLAEETRRGQQLSAVIMVLLARLGDPSRVTVEEAAALEKRIYGRGSVAGVRRKIAEGTYKLEKRDGEKQARIPVDQVYAGYVPIDVWRTAVERMKRQEG